MGQAKRGIGRRVFLFLLMFLLAFLVIKVTYESQRKELGSLSMTIDRDICSRARCVFPGGRCGIIFSLMRYLPWPIGGAARVNARLLTLALALGGAGAGPALATEPYGERVVAAQAAWVDEAAPRVALDQPRIPAGQRSAARQRVQHLRQRLREQELAQGPYAAPLAETLTELARAVDALGDDAAALKARERALHLTRVNEGLYSAAQAPLLRALLEGHRRRGEFARLDERYDYFFRLYGAGRPPWTEARWSARRCAGVSTAPMCSAGCWSCTGATRTCSRPCAPPGRPWTGNASGMWPSVNSKPCI